MKWENYTENTNEVTRENEGSWGNQEPCGYWGGPRVGRTANVHPESQDADKISTVTDRSSSWR